MDEIQTPFEEQKAVEIGINSEKNAKLEALLFYYGEPISIKRIAKLLEWKEKECEEVITQFEKRIQEDATRGIFLVRRGTEIQFSTKPDFQKIGEKIMKEEFREQLTPAALETLSLVAYLGPVPRSTIDFIRGVNSSFILRNLLMRGLIDRNEEAEKGNIYYYQPSFDFLKHMGVSKPEELPEFEYFKTILARFETQAAEIQTAESSISTVETISESTKESI